MILVVVVDYVVEYIRVMFLAFRLVNPFWLMIIRKFALSTCGLIIFNGWMLVDC